MNIDLSTRYIGRTGSVAVGFIARISLTGDASFGSDTFPSMGSQSNWASDC